MNPVAQCIIGTAFPFTFSPKVISGLRWWLDANQIGLSDGTAVSTWNDLSGNGFDATQATGVNQPIFHTNVIGGKPAVQFDGSNDFMSMTGPAVQPHSTFAVIRPTLATASQKTYATLFNGASSSSFQIYVKLSTNFWGGYAGGDFSSGQALSANTNYLVEITATSGSTILYQRGTQEATTVNTETTSSTAALGKDGQFSSREYAGYIAEVVIYNSVLSTADRQSVENYLIAKYSL